MVEMRANLQPRISTAQTPMPDPPSKASLDRQAGRSVLRPAQRYILGETQRPVKRTANGPCRI